MLEFTYHIDDDRQAAASVRRAHVRDEAEALKLAARILRETYHHRAVEVWSGEHLILTLRSDEAGESTVPDSRLPGPPSHSTDRAGARAS
jgi:hypothetical protein